jgi:fumarate reductase subunit C
MKMKEFFAYGEKVDGYDVRVVNEREARAGAGLLFAFGLIGLLNSITLGHVIFTKYFITFFTLDFLIRVINPSFSPSLLIGRFFVQNQTPEYVGATQKRFAWGIGLLLAIPMFYTLVIDFQPTPVNVFICVLCLLLLIAESAFSICAGCKLFNLIYKEKATNCPGGACEIRQKDKIQTFNTAQKIIAITFSIVIVYGIYTFITKVESKTFLAKKITEMMMSDAELEALKEKKMQEEFDAFEEEDF